MSSPSRLPATTRGLALLQAARLHNGLACALLAIAGLWHGGRLGSPEAALPLAAPLALVILLLAAASHLANDIVDLTADRANRPRRPLPSGRLSLGAARIGFLLCLAAGVLLGALALPGWWPWWLGWAAAGPGYSLVAKGRGWLGPLWTALVIASCYLPGAAADGLGLRDAALCGIVGYFIFFREYVKSLEDAGGDGAAGYRSLAVGRWVRRRSGVLLALPLLAGGILATARGPLATWNQLAGGGFVLCLLAAVVSLPYSRWRRGHAAGTLLKAGAFCGLGLLWGMTA